MGQLSGIARPQKEFWYCLKGTDSRKLLAEGNSNAGYGPPKDAGDISNEQYGNDMVVDVGFAKLFSGRLRPRPGSGTCRCPAIFL